MLSVDKIKVKYKEITALHDISLTVNEGEIVTVLGSNGAGKSTLLKSIASLLEPVEGSITFQRKQITGIGPHQVVRNGISLVPEGKRIFAKMSIEENLLLGAYIMKEEKVREETKKKLFQLFPRLHERIHQKAGTLSGGEQQMLAIARGLMSRPKLLMLDEPSMGIAPNLVSRIFEAIETIRSSGLTILIVEQHVQEALDIADRGYILQTGKIALEGSAEELMESDLVQKAYLGI
ncbi:MAG: ABC transporter ATP-binding protein [Deltaproteobacteria bacterium]|nr:ABC transporter ATP-binding protein [Deltaproteobacteria bacterium]